MIDGNYNFAKKQIDSDFHFDYQSIIKGDTKIASIAAASIIAKVKRDRFMNMAEKKYPNYDFAKHKGYGTKAHIEKIQLYDYSKLHRKTFKLKNGNF